jgi:hypothetical protein
VAHDALQPCRHDKVLFKMPSYVGSVCCFAPLNKSFRAVDCILGQALLATQLSKNHTRTAVGPGEGRARARGWMLARQTLPLRLQPLVEAVEGGRSGTRLHSRHAPAIPRPRPQSCGRLRLHHRDGFLPFENSLPPLARVPIPSVPRPRPPTSATRAHLCAAASISALTPSASRPITTASREGSSSWVLSSRRAS